jgi:hypothetical protein
MSDSVVSVPREFQVSLVPHEPNVIELLNGIQGDVIHLPSGLLLLKAIQKIQEGCKHEPGRLFEDLILQPSLKENVFLAQTAEGLLITLPALCKKCNLLGRYFVGQICSGCLGDMRKVRHPCEIGMHDIYHYVPNLRANGGPWHSGVMSTCDACQLTVVWNSHSYTFDYSYKPVEK